MTAGFHKSLPAEAENHRLFYAKMTVNVPQTIGKFKETWKQSGVDEGSWEIMNKFKK